MEKAALILHLLIHHAVLDTKVMTPKKDQKTSIGRHNSSCNGTLPSLKYVTIHNHHLTHIHLANTTQQEDLLILTLTIEEVLKENNILIDVLPFGPKPPQHGLVISTI